MPIQTGPSKAELLYRAIGEVARGLGFADRLKLFGAMKEATPFQQLPAHLQAAFITCAEKVGLR